MLKLLNYEQLGLPGLSVTSVVIDRKTPQGRRDGVIMSVSAVSLFFIISCDMVQLTFNLDDFKLESLLYHTT